MVKVRRPETVQFSRYFHFCNVLRLWSVRAIPTYRVYWLYDSTWSISLHMLEIVVSYFEQACELEYWFQCVCHTPNACYLAGLLWQVLWSDRSNRYSKYSSLFSKRNWRRICDWPESNISLTSIPTLLWCFSSASSPLSPSPSPSPLVQLPWIYHVHT